MNEDKPKYYVGHNGLYRTKRFSDPQELWDAFCEYVQWIKQNPWHKHEAIKSGDNAGQIIDIPIERPMTQDSFERYIGLSADAFEDYGRNIEFSGTCKEIKKVCRTQKFEGAVVGAFNPLIIARDLGLREKTDVEMSGQVDTKVTIKIDDSACRI